MAIYVGRGHSLPADIALSLIPSLPRPTLERLAQLLIDGLDDMDGDSDVEESGDERDGGNAEDDFGIMPNWLQGPGCPIADPDEEVPRGTPATYDGEDQSVIILPAPKGVEPTRYQVS